MASVLFSTIGQAVGGPFAAGIGAAVGASLDSARSRRGAADDSYVQRSAYGEVVPRLFGTTRMAGHLVWALPPATGRGRKGDGRREADASFAIALSSGPIRGVKRIWADGREIRSSSGQFAFDVTMRLHSAPVAQADPLIVAAEGGGGAPALRGLSHVVFEGFPLAPFGNRIPSLSFELVADEEGANGWLAAVAAEAGISAGLTHSPVAVAGFTSSGTSRSDDLQRLSRIAGAELVLAEGRLRFEGAVREFDVAMDERLRGADDPDDDQQSVKVDAPSGLSLTYIDPDREYQRGLQRVGRDRSGRQLQLSWAVCCAAEGAIALSNRLLQREEAGSDRMTLQLPPRWLHLSVGDRLRYGDGGKWRIVRREIRNLSVTVEAERSANIGIGVSRPADPGRNLPQPVLPAGPTSLLVFESPVPVFGDGPSVMVAGGGLAGWRGADVGLLSSGENRAVGRLEAGRGFGELVAPLPAGATTIWDERYVVMIRLFGADSLVSREHVAVLAGAGLVLIGEELIQFREVERSGDDIVRLTGLLRGRFGTRMPENGWPVGTSIAEGSFSEMPAVSLSVEAIGRDLVFLAEGRGDPPGGTSILHRVDGQGLAPLAPVHVSARLRADGALECRWMDRVRSGWSWADEGQVSEQRYLWRVRGQGGEERAMPVVGTALVLDVQQQIALLGAPLAAGECQLEAVGDGPPWVRRSKWVGF